MSNGQTKRGIVLYINGMEINNSIKSVAAEMKKLSNQQALMTIGSQEYVEAAKKIQALKGIMAEHRESITKTSSAFDKLKDSVISLLPALSFAAIGAGIVSAFGKIKDSTAATSDAFEFAMKGMSTGLDFFWKTLASGDWSNFFKNLNKAIEGGYKYAKMLDEVSDNNRALRIIESKARGEELRFEEDLKNKGLSIEARLKAGKARIKLEEDLSKDRQIIANKNYSAEFDEASRVTKLNEDQLLSVAGVIDSEEKMQASAYNDKVENYAKLKALNVIQQSSLYGKGASIQAPDTKEMIGLKAEIDSTKESVKNYAGFLQSYDTLADTQQEKLISAVEKRNEAINSAPENLKKVITKVNSLLAGLDDTTGLPIKGAGSAKAISKKESEDKKTAEKAAEKEINEALKLAHAERVLILTRQYSDDERSQKEFHLRMLAEEEAYLRAQIGFEKDPNKSITLQTQLITKHREYTAALKEATPEIMLNSAERKNLSSNMLEESKITANSAYALVKAGIEADEYAIKMKNHAEIYQQSISLISDGLYEMMSGSEDAFKNFGKSILIFALEQLKIQTEIAIAGTTIQSLAQPDSVATFGATGLLRAALLVGIIESVFAVAEGAVNGALGGKKKNGYAEGGYTGDGSVDEQAGIVHRGEYVIPRSLVRNPGLAPIINSIETMRRNPIFPPQMNPQLMNISSNQLRGSSLFSPATMGANSRGEYELHTVLAKLNKTNEETNQILHNLNEKGIKAKVSGYGGEGSVAYEIRKIAALAKSLKL